MTRTVIAQNTGEHYKTIVTNGVHQLIADELPEDGGQDLGFTPHELLASALASCTAITLRMYADRKQWVIPDISVQVNINREVINGNTKTEFEITLNLKGNIDNEQKVRLKEIAAKCPVHKTLSGTIHLKTIMS
jgi:putative redox protein